MFGILGPRAVALINAYISEAGSPPVSLATYIVIINRSNSTPGPYRFSAKEFWDRSGAIWGNVLILLQPIIERVPVHYKYSKGKRSDHDRSLHTGSHGQASSVYLAG